LNRAKALERAVVDFDLFDIARYLTLAAPIASFVESLSFDVVDKPP